MLSIIIVNYNVKYFLEQCLYAVCAASAKIETEIIVVDNHSVDDSIAYLSAKFPSVKFITNGTNSGFSKACNYGLKQSAGNYILFLNPDTIIAEDSLSNTINFFETHPDCGALGVKMIDGSGRFLKESKRAFPSPLTSLFKLAGLSYLFPRSSLFSRYHLGHLDKNNVQEVDVLAGAFFMTRKEVLQNVGSFDEDFFMYGEDVDLSYRIQKAGYKNYYYPQTTIIHFKGESTKRGSLNYVRMFYQAMHIFVKKHYGGTRARVFQFFIQLAIGIRAFLAAGIKLIKWIGVPVIDAVIILLAFFIVKEFWVRWVHPDIVYPDQLLLISFPVFSIIYLMAAYYAGLYDRYYKLNILFRATIIATVTLLSLYSLLPEQLRFSRGIVLFGALLAFLFITAQRWFLIKVNVIAPPDDSISTPNIIIAAPEEEFIKVKKFLSDKGFGERVIGRASIDNDSNNAIAQIDTVAGTAKLLGGKEIVFCARTLSYKKIIELTEKNSSCDLRFRYHAANSTSIVGSDTSTESGETISATSAFSLDHPSCKRVKRLIDVSSSFFFLLTFPFHFFGVQKPASFFANCIAVIAGKKTWVGYARQQPGLPKLRSSVLHSTGLSQAAIAATASNASLLDYWYARNYEPVQDIKTILSGYSYLGNE